MKKYFSIGILVLLFLFVLFGPIPVPASMGRGDFRAYWSAAKLLSQSENFGDAQLLLQTEQTHTKWQEDWAVITWNPPWLLALLLPYTLVSFERATWLWLLTNITLVFTGAVLIWQTLATPNNGQRQSYFAPLIGLLFLPTMIALLMGQVNVLVFMGLAGFVFFYNRRAFFFAGLCLVLTLVKPHLVYVTIPIIFLQLLWVKRDFRAMAGLILGLVALTAVVLLLRPSFIVEYTQTVNEGSLLAWETPTLGGLLGALFGWQWAKLMGIVILPLAIWLWWQGKEKVAFNIWVQISILISVITAPFGWAYDVVVLLLPLLQIFIWILDRRVHRLETLAWSFVLIGINISAIYQRNLGISELHTFWVPIALAITYFLACWRFQRAERLWANVVVE